MDDKQNGPEPAPEESLVEDAQAHLEAAEAADDETRLKVLEDLYRSLETTLEGSGNPSKG
jgi:hypothetical protein